MCRAANFLGLAALMLLSACQSVTVVPLPERVEAAVGGPERVFARPVTEIVPLLQNAQASGPRGRVGSELVFWGYQLADERPAFLVACAVLPDVDCAARLPQVCASGAPEVLFSQQDQGEVRFLHCREIGVAAPGDLTPNCADVQKVQAVDVTLLSCR
jgi:hypothetical protein